MESNLEGFTLFFGLAEGIGVITLVLLTIWLCYYRGGFAWTSNPGLEFNWHPLLMTVGLIFMYANSIMIYRAFRSTRKHQLKLAHTFIHLSAFVLTVIGLQAVFDSHNLNIPNPIPNMYSLHSWIGLTAVILFACQWVAGLVSFLYPTLGAHIRAAYLPVHVYFGLLGFGLAVAASLLGLSEKAFFSVKQYSTLPAEGVLINIIGVGLIIFAALVVYLTTEPRYKRQPIPEDEMLLRSSDSTVQ